LERSLRASDESRPEDKSEVHHQIEGGEGGMTSGSIERPATLLLVQSRSFPRFLKSTNDRHFTSLPNLPFQEHFSAVSFPDIHSKNHPFGYHSIIFLNHRRRPSLLLDILFRLLLERWHPCASARTLNPSAQILGLELVYRRWATCAGARTLNPKP
jgi:hypothetical protein